jgi:hypothetical protein
MKTAHLDQDLCGGVSSVSRVLIETSGGANKSREVDVQSEGEGRRSASGLRNKKRPERRCRSTDLANFDRLESCGAVGRGEQGNKLRE